MFISQQKKQLKWVLQTKLSNYQEEFYHAKHYYNQKRSIYAFRGSLEGAREQANKAAAFHAFR